MYYQDRKCCARPKKKPVLTDRDVFELFRQKKKVKGRNTDETSMGDSNFRKTTVHRRDDRFLIARNRKKAQTEENQARCDAREKKK